MTYGPSLINPVLLIILIFFSVTYFKHASTNACHTQSDPVLRMLGWKCTLFPRSLEPTSFCLSDGSSCLSPAWEPRATPENGPRQGLPLWLYLVLDPAWPEKDSGLQGLLASAPLSATGTQNSPHPHWQGCRGLRPARHLSTSLWSGSRRPVEVLGLLLAIAGFSAAPRS